MSTIDLMPIITQVFAMVATILFGLIAKVVHDVNARAIIHKGLDMAVSYAIQTLSKADWTKIETRNAIVAAAVNYAISNFNGALNYFGITREKLEMLILARLSLHDENLGQWDAEEPDPVTAVDIKV